MVAAARSRRHQRQTRVNRRIEFRLCADSAGHQTPGVERDDNCLVALDLILARRQFRASGGWRPGNMPLFVAAHVIAQGLKLAPLAATNRSALNGKVRIGAERF